MAFRQNTAQQLSVNDAFLNLSERKRNIVEKSWAKDFSEIVFPAINEERFSGLYSQNTASRSNTPINIVVGALMIKSMLHLTDDEMFESINCDIRFQYALHTTSFDEQPISDRTFSRFRERLYNYQLATGEDLLADEMKHLSKVYQDFLDLHSNIKRMDSMMIATSAKRMSRLEIIYTVNSNAVKYLVCLGMEDHLNKKLMHYIEPDDINQVIYHSKDEEVKDKLERAIEESAILKQIMDNDEMRESQEFQLLVRVLNEQTVFDGEAGSYKPKQNKDISSKSLQNPSDEDATFRMKAGKQNKGYVGNFVETIDENGRGIITDFDFQNNIYSDSNFCKDYINNHDSGEKETLIADGAYGGDENVKLAQEKNIELVTTALVGKTTNEVFSEFQFSDEGEKVKLCPAGNEPISSKLNETSGSFRVVMARTCCENCPNRDKCKARIQRKTAVVTVSKKMAERASYVKKLKTECYRKLTHMRNAIEGIPSVLRRKYKVDNSPFRGLIKTGWTYSLAIGAYNINSLIRYRKREKSVQMVKLVGNC